MNGAPRWSSHMAPPTFAAPFVLQASATHPGRASSDPLFGFVGSERLCHGDRSIGRCIPSGSVPCRIDLNSVCSVSASNPLLCVPVAPSRCLRTRKTQTQRAKGQPAAEGAGACEGRRRQSRKSMPRCHLRPHPLARLRRVGLIRQHPLARVHRVGGHLGPEACCPDRWPA